MEPRCVAHSTATLVGAGRRAVLLAVGAQRRREPQRRRAAIAPPCSHGAVVQFEWETFR